MNSEKYMNSKKSFLFTTFLLLVLQDASLSLSLQCFVSKTPLINYICILGHQVFVLYVFLLACVGTKGVSQLYHLSFDDNKVLKIINWIC